MEVSYKRYFNRSYMILQGEPDPEEIYELTVLAYNRIPGLLAMETEVADGALHFWYDITGKQNLRDCLERKQADSELLILLFHALGQVCQEIPAYLLREEHILLDLEHLYLDFTHKKIEFVYLPGRQRDIRDSFRELMELLLRKLDHSDKQGSAMAYEMYQLSLQKDQALEEMIRQAGETGRKMTEREIQKEQPETVNKPQAEREETAEKEAHVCRLKTENLAGNIVNWLKNRFYRRERQEELPYVTQEEKIVTYPTEILNCRDKIQGILQYQGNNGQRDIRINKAVFLIGKDAGEVDGCIEERSVSRVHAKILFEDENYYLEDMNSTNGTFINGELVEYRQKVKLELKDRVNFGGAEYIFV